MRGNAPASLSFPSTVLGMDITSTFVVITVGTTVGFFQCNVRCSGSQINYHYHAASAAALAAAALAAALAALAFAAATARTPTPRSTR
jgi:hypothetical protein